MICGSLMQMLWAREKYIKMTMMMGEEYTNALIKSVTYPHMALVYPGIVVKLSRQKSKLFIMN